MAEVWSGYGGNGFCLILLVPTGRPWDEALSATLFFTDGAFFES